jgi:hypothetical protein
MQIDERDEHSANAEFSIRESRESFSNTTLERAVHEAKHFLEMSSTLDGTQTACIEWP